ncbi:MAG TPA: cation-translocating P-type ATPase [Acidimicrobiia bacterium]
MSSSPHAISVDDVATELGVDQENGIGEAEAARRLDEVGPNRIEEDTGPTRWDLLARQFTDVLVLILIVAALISGVLLGDWLEALVIVAIVMVNAAIGFVQEAKAADAAAGLRQMTSPVGKVIRGGEESQVATEEIVPGDLIIIETGDRVFADARLVSISRLQVDESELTGESTPVEKTTEPVARDVGIGDRSSMIFAGTVAVAGRARALVTSTGPATEIGKIAGMLREEEPPTPLERELSHVGRRLGVLAGAVAVVVFGVGLAQGRPLESMFLLAVALAVAAIPEGLPAVVGVTLGLGVQRMARRNAIVRRLPAVEALGAVTVICTDKTGTLTRNEMWVQMVEFDGKRIFDLVAAANDPRMRRFAELAILCNDARGDDGGWSGDPTEIGLLRSARQLIDPAALRKEWPRVDEIPFESARKRMTTLHRGDDGYLVIVKGAPEAVVPDCKRVETEDGVEELDEDVGREWLAAAEEMAAQGLRTLTLAYRRLDSVPSELSEVDDELILLVLVGISDQIRDEAKASIEEAVGAGVKVIMITGDHVVTARAIADDLNLLGGREVLSGRELQSMDDDTYQANVNQIGTYARVDPSDKVRIVRAWQGEGEIVAMTGDGVNDAPALRISDIGVAMGSGTDVARDASDIVLADDNFATIVAAVRGGRTIFANIRLVIAFLLAANVSEIIVVFIGFLIYSALGDPLLATQILWVNLITDGLPAVTLGFDPPDHLVMARPPSRRRSLLDRSSHLAILIRGSLLAGVVLIAYAWGVDRELEWEATRTVGFTTLVLVQLAYIYGLRVSESGWRDGFTRNRLLHGAIVLSVILQGLVVATPIGNEFFSTVPLTAWQWMLSVGLAVVGFLIVVVASRVAPALFANE